MNPNAITESDLRSRNQICERCDKVALDSALEVASPIAGIRAFLQQELLHVFRAVEDKLLLIGDHEDAPLNHF